MVGMIEIERRWGVWWDPWRWFSDIMGVLDRRTFVVIRIVIIIIILVICLLCRFLAPLRWVLLMSSCGFFIAISSASSRRYKGNSFMIDRGFVSLLKATLNR